MYRLIVASVLVLGAFALPMTENGKIDWSKIETKYLIFMTKISNKATK